MVREWAKRAEKAGEEAGQWDGDEDPWFRLPSLVRHANQRAVSFSSLPFLEYKAVRVLSGRYHKNIPPGNSTILSWLFLCVTFSFVASSNVQAKVFFNATYIYANARQRRKYVVSKKMQLTLLCVAFQTKTARTGNKSNDFLLGFCELNASFG